MLSFPSDARLAAIRERKSRPANGDSFDDGVYLYDRARPVRGSALTWPTRCARRKNGNFTYFNVNEHTRIRPTCIASTAAPSARLRADLKSEKGYVAERRARCWSVAPAEADRRGATELHRRRSAPPAALRVVSKHHPYYPQNVSAFASEGIHGGRVGLVRAPDRPADARPLGRVQGRRPRQACPVAAPRFSIPKCATRFANTRPTPPSGSASIVSRTNWACSFQRDDALWPHRGDTAPHHTTA